MIKPHCFHKDWLDSFRAQKQYSRINPPLLEKMVHAFSLLQYLQTEGLSFIFKGGTSLILLLENSNRFSVDIDIITEASRKTVEQVLTQVVEVSHFKGWKPDEKRSYGNPKDHVLQNSKPVLEAFKVILSQAISGSMKLLPQQQKLLTYAQSF